MVSAFPSSARFSIRMFHTLRPRAPGPAVHQEPDATAGVTQRDPALTQDLQVVPGEVGRLGVAVGARREEQRALRGTRGVQRAPDRRPVVRAVPPGAEVEHVEHRVVREIFGGAPRDAAAGRRRHLLGPGQPSIPGRAGRESEKSSSVHSRSLLPSVGRDRLLRGGCVRPRMRRVRAASSALSKLPRAIRPNGKASHRRTRPATSSAGLGNGRSRPARKRARASPAINPSRRYS